MNTQERLWSEHFPDLSIPDRVWLCMWKFYKLQIVIQSFDEIKEWRKKRPYAKTLDVAKMITARCRLLDLGERPLREPSGEELEYTYTESWGKD